MPLHGVSMAYSFDDATARRAPRDAVLRDVLNRGIYHKGWTAVTRHSIPWVMTEIPALDDDVWELYGPDDWTQAHDLSEAARRSLQELQRLFLIEAAKYNVLPLDDRRVERFNADLAGRPQLIKGNSQMLFGGMGRLSENSIVVIKNKSHAVTAEVDVPDDWCRRRDRRPGRRFRRLDPVHEGRQAGLLLQPVRPPAVQGLRRRSRSRPASTRCAWSSTTTAVDLARADGDALPRREQGRRGARRRHRADGSSRRTRRPTSAPTAGRR